MHDIRSYITKFHIISNFRVRYFYLSIFFPFSGFIPVYFLQVTVLNNNLGGNQLIYNEGEDAYYIQHGADSVPKKLGSSGKITKLGAKQIKSTTGSTSWTVPQGTTLSQILVYIESYYCNVVCYEESQMVINSNLSYNLSGTTLTATVRGYHIDPGYRYSNDLRLYPTLNAIIVK